MQAMCFERLTDPRTKQVIAAYGWLQERRELPGKYWVSLERDSFRFFPTREATEEYYKINTKPLRLQLQIRGLRGQRKKRKQDARQTAA